MRGYGTGSIPGGAPTQNLNSLMNNGVGGGGSYDNSGTTTEDKLANIDKNIQKLADRLAPPRVLQSLKFTGFKVGDPAKKFQVDSNVVNGFCATIVTGRISVFIGALSDVNSEVPDFVYSSINPDSQYTPLPPVTNQDIIIISTDPLNDASGTLWLFAY